MSPWSNASKRVPVLIAVAVVVVLAGTLGARLCARTQSQPAPAASVPPPAVQAWDTLEAPCWSCPEAKGWRVRFQTDLDLLAPLGTGTANAGEWFAPFAKEVGSRADEAEQAANDRIQASPEWVGMVLPPDHPLLLEAEPWVDQATMTFYPDLFALDGYNTRVPNLLFALNLVRSWVARGLAAETSEAAMADFRRAIRLGRLLRQEDVVIINDLVGLACIHLGTRGMYERAQADGDLELALLASVVLGEVAPQRLRTMELVTATDLADCLHRTGEKGLDLELDPGKLGAIADAARSAADRRFRMEAIVGLNIVRSLGSVEEQAEAAAVLEELTTDSDPEVAVAARWALDHPAIAEEIIEVF
jgi:hypothetical protein